MALTITEQLQLINGNVQPPSGALKTLTYQTAIKFAMDFYDTYKIIDSNLTPLGHDYLTKMFGVAQRVLTQNNNVIDQLTRIIIAIISRQDVTLDDVKAAPNELWEEFVYNQMDEAFEYLSGVKREEKTAYNAVQGNK